MTFWEKRTLWKISIEATLNTSVFFEKKNLENSEKVFVKYIFFKSILYEHSLNSSEKVQKYLKKVSTFY